MGKQYRSSQRRGDQMARGNKIINSNKSDDHLGREQTLREDSITQTVSHTNKVRAKKALPPHQIVDPVFGPGSKDDTINNRILENPGDEELVSDAGLIIGIRAYSGGAGASVNGDEFVAIHRQVRRERDRYRELNGAMVEVGKTVPRSDANRKDKIRKVPGILKSIMVRLMPTEAEAVGVADMNRKDVEAAMDKTVTAFEQATGCQVVTAVAHRMSVTDLHIHIQYTQVLPFTETSYMLGRRLKPWKVEASRKARESLRADGIERPAPAQIGARKKRLIAEGYIDPPPEHQVEYRKFTGLRALGDGAILGYSFRQKLNLVRAAEQGGDKELAEKVAHRNDERWGRFTPISKRPDDVLETKYLDLWLERLWRRNVTSKLPEEYSDQLLIAGVEAAKNYVDFGTSVVEETHINRRIKELDARAKEIEVQKETAKNAERLDREAKLAAEEESTLLKVNNRMLEEKVGEQSERIADLDAKTAEFEEKRAVLDDQAKRAEERVASIRMERDGEKIRRQHVESEFLQIHSTLAPQPGESLMSAAKRVAKQAAEMVGFRKRTTELTAQLQVAENDSQNTKNENQQLRGELEQSQKTIADLLSEIAPLRTLKEQASKFIEVLNKMQVPAAILKAVDGLLQKIGELVGLPFNPKSPESPEMKM